MAASQPHHLLPIVPPAETALLTDLYDVGRLLGKGAFGAVHVGTERKPAAAGSAGARVALKFLKHGRGYHATREQVLEEIRLLHFLSTTTAGHFAPRLLHWFDIKGWPGTAERFPRASEIVMVTELAAGGELLKALNSQITHHHRHGSVVFAEATARRVLTDVCGALCVLHSAGIVHRDIKLDNVLVLEEAPRGSDPGLVPPLRGDATFLLADLGLAWDTSRPDSRAGCLGTPLWRSPEILRGAPATPKSDVWAAGTLLFVMLTGRYPIVDAKEHEYIVAQGHTPPRWALLERIVPPVSAPVREILASMLALDPAHRPTAEAVLAHPWLKSAAAEMDDHVPAALAPVSRTLTPQSFAEYHFEPGQLDALRKHFDALCAPPPGAVVTEGGAAGAGITRAALDDALVRVLGVPKPTVTELLDNQALYEVLDVDHNGLIDWREFLVLLPLLSVGAPPRLAELPEETLRLLCLCFDANADGRLERDDVRRMMHVMHAARPPAPADVAAADNVFSQLEHKISIEDESGVHTPREFVELETFIAAVRAGKLTFDSPLPTPRPSGSLP